MTNLGFWQLRRLDERQSANAVVEEAMTRPPTDIALYKLSMNATAATNDVSGGDESAGDGRDAADGGRDAAGGGRNGTVDGHVSAGDEQNARGGGQESGGFEVGDLPDYTAVTIKGVYRPDAEVLIGHRSYQGQPGYWLATPIEIEDGRNVVVVRGWVPRRNVAGVDTRPTAAPGGLVNVTGLAFESVSGGRLAVTQDDETPELSRVDLQLFEQVSGLEVLDRWVRLITQMPSQTELPVPVAMPDLSNGPHLSYAFQWFFFSAATVVVYVLILRRALAAANQGTP